jgi:chromosome segregation protein
MRLKQLRISGFKSFAQDVTLSFEQQGITAIVGPNGCGKSNVADAIRWVLGEQSSRSLRCARMEDVLFNGGSEHTPAKIADVSLTLSNEDGLLPLDSPVVTVSRQLHRTGESRYFLNGSACLLRDIQELFLDTGVGKTAYSLMEQSNIDLILNARPEDRRYVFDEVAGINKYKHRKKAALKKLEETEQNLVRINDVISELEQETESLRVQAERALHYRQRHDELRALEVELSRRQWKTLRERLASVTEEFEAVQENARALAEALESLDRALAQRALRREALDAEIHAAQSQIHKLETETERTESAIAVYRERQTALSEQRQNTTSQIETLRTQLERLTHQIQERERERDQLQVSLGLDEGRLKGRVRVLEELSRQISAAEAEIEDARAKTLELLNEGARAQNELSTLENRAEYSQSQRARLDGECERLGKELDAARQRTLDAKRRVADLQAQLASLKATLSQHDHDIERAQAEARRLEAEMRGQQDALGMAVSRAKSLEELQKSYEGYYLGVRAVLRVHEQEPDRLPGICGVVAELVRTEPQYEQAMEVALGSAIQNVVAETADDAKVAIAFLKQHRAGRVTFLPLDILRPRRRVEGNLLRYPGVVGFAPKLVSAEPKYHVVVEYLLGNVLVVDTLDAAVHIARRENPAVRLVTLEGEIINPGGAMTGGTGREQAAGFLQRPREIEDLKERIAQLSDALARKEERRARLAEELARLQKDRSAAQTRLQALEIEKAGGDKDVAQAREREERLEQERAVTESERDLLTEETGDIARERDTAKARLEELHKERQAAQRLVERLQEQTASEAAKRAEIQESVTAMKVELAGRREKVETAAQVIASLRQNADEVQRSIEEYERAIANSEEVVRDLDARIAEAQRSFLLLEQKKFEHAEEMARMEAERGELIAAIGEQEKTLRQQRRELDRLEKLRHGLEVSCTQIHMEERAIAERIQEKYRVAVADVRQNEQVGADDDRISERIRELQAQIESMGAVNLMAVEAYDEHHRRQQFLTTQRDDLDAAKGSLLKAVQRINETSRALFLETFEKVQANFQEVFSQLFGGGETELRLLDADDVLEAGVEIIARPPGKRPQSISMLSGGERSLVAIALLFAVFKIRPSPFSVLDEVDAALDEANVLRFASLIRDYASDTQFLIITHNKRTMEKADLLYGVTMEKAGVSTVVSVKFAE